MGSERSDSPPLTVVGAINLDLTATTRRAPERGETVADGILTRGPGGKGANQAVAAARLGAPVRLIGAVGSDATGTAILGSLAAAGVDISPVQRVAGETGTAIIVVDSTGENSIVVCPEANSRIEPSLIDLPPHGALLAQLEVADDVIERAIAATDGFIAINASPARMLSAAIRDRVDLVIVNEHEYAMLPSLRSAPLLAVTLGSRGARLLADGEVVAESDGRAARAVNSVGAGDAFAAALTLGILRGDPLPEALHRACLVGAAAVEDPDSQPALQRLDDYPSS